MDANGQRFWMVAGAEHWPWRSHTVWDGGCRSLRLASERELPEPADPAESHATANTALERVPRSEDGAGGVGYWSPEAGAIVVRSHIPGDVVRLELSQAPSDLAVGHDGVLYVAVSGTVRMHDLRGRWDDVTVEEPDFNAWRLEADPSGGVWVLDRTGGRLARLTGRPRPMGPVGDYAGTTFRPDPEHGCPPALAVVFQGVWDTGERPVALAHHPVRGLAVLTWVGSGAHAHVRIWDTDRETFLEPYSLSGARYAYALSFVDQDTMAVRVPGRADAPAFSLTAADADRQIRPSGDVFPLSEDALEAPFGHRQTGAPRYPVSLTEEGVGLRPLHRLSLTNLAKRGEARTFSEGGSHLLDSGDQRTVWHRLYAEARLPAGTGFVVWVATSEEPRPPDPTDRSHWCPHTFGQAFTGEPHAPVAVREAASSELPHHPGLDAWLDDDEQSGLWSVLLQNPRARVRRLVGRYLWIRVEVIGDGRVGPEIVALRAWEDRFSYRDRYLPRLYRESRFGAPAREPGALVGRIPASLAEELDGGGPLQEPLRAALREVGVEPGPSTRVRVERSGQSWLVGDARGRRAWRLRLESLPAGPGIGVYRPESTGADFLERFLSSFEGVLTPLEDRIASTHLLSEPTVAPVEGLDWLASWTGVSFDPALPEERRRAWLMAGPALARHHGTRRGMELALDVASGGGVSGGEIVVLEDFRLRRLLATLLGVDLGVEDDPLLPGLVVSGNSVVGDTLVLGEAERTELLALFREEVATEAENASVRAFYQRLAYRATVFVHDRVSDTDLGLLRRIVTLEGPAHCDVRVVTATWPLMVGVGSLVGVDTYLGPRSTRRPARVEQSLAGRDYVIGPSALDPRMAGASGPAPGSPPVADAGSDRTAPLGESFELDGSGSTAGPRRSIDLYRWRRLPPE